MSLDESVFKIIPFDHTRAVAIFDELAQKLFRLLPFAEIEHIGGTAVPGSVGKGDIDVMVRVAAADFKRAERLLEREFERDTGNEQGGSSASFTQADGECGIGVQLVAAGGLLDDFRAHKLWLLAHPDVLEEYNDLKRRWDNRDMESYRAAKGAFFEGLAKKYGLSAAGGRDASVRPGIYY